MLLELLAPDMARRYLDFMTTSNFEELLGLTRDRPAA
jgi:hypothetical protein